MNTEGDSEGQGRDELDGLRIYLSQLVQHATTDGVLLSTIYQYMDAVQREIKSLMSVNAVRATWQSDKEVNSVDHR
jgi:hypothetical protein